MRLPDRELRVILPILCAVARTQVAPNLELDSAIARLTQLAVDRGLGSLLADVERRAEHDAANLRRFVDAA